MNDHILAGFMLLVLRLLRVIARGVCIQVNHEGFSDVANSVFDEASDFEAVLRKWLGDD